MDFCFSVLETSEILMLRRGEVLLYLQHYRGSFDGGQCNSIILYCIQHNNNGFKTCIKYNSQ